MKIFKLLIMFITVGLFITQPAFTQLIATLDQTIITVSKIKQPDQVIAADGTVFKVNSAEAKQKIKSFSGQRIRVLYVLMGEQQNITDVKLAIEPPFIIQENNVLSKNSKKVMK